MFEQVLGKTYFIPAVKCVVLKQLKLQKCKKNAWSHDLLSILGEFCSGRCCTMYSLTPLTLRSEQKMIFTLASLQVCWDINTVNIYLFSTDISDLNLKVAKDGYSAIPLTMDGFGFLWSGVKLTHGVSKGKICYQVKVSQLLLDFHVQVNLFHIVSEDAMSLLLAV